MLTKDDFDKYHQDNPRVFELFERFSLEAINAGRRHFGAQLIIERMRWYTTIETKGDPYKINNDYASFYSRMFEDKYPQYKGFFRKRRSVADKQ